MALRPPHAFRNFSIQPAKLGLVIPPGASIVTDDPTLAAQLELDGGRQGVRPELAAAERAATDGADADAAEVIAPDTKPKRSTKRSS